MQRRGWPACEGLIRAWTKGQQAPPSLQSARREESLSLTQPTAFCLLVTTQSRFPTQAEASLLRQGRITTKKLSLLTVPNPKHAFSFCGFFLLFFFLIENQKPFLATFQLLFSCSAIAVSSRLNLSLAGASKSPVTTAEDTLFGKISLS